MTEFGRCQCKGCRTAAHYRLDWRSQPGSLRCCSDCAEELAGIADELTRLGTQES